MCSVDLPYRELLNILLWSIYNIFRNPEFLDVKSFEDCSIEVAGIGQHDLILEIEVYTIVNHVTIMFIML